MGEPTTSRRAVVLSALRRPRLRRVAAVFMCFKTAEMGVWIAIVTVAYTAGGVGAATTVLLVQLAPAAVAALGVDRLTRAVGDGPVLVGGLAVQCVGLVGVVGALVTGAPMAVVYAAAAVASVGVVTTRPSLSSLLPQVVEVPDELTAANSMMGWLDGAATLLGPAISAAAFAVSTDAAPFVVFAVMTAVGAVLATRLHRREDPAVHHADRAPAARTPAAATPDRADDGTGTTATGAPAPLGPVRATLVVLGAYGFLLGALDVLQVVVAIDLTGGTPARAALMGTAFGFGALLGGVASTLLIGQRHLWPAIVVPAVVSGSTLAAVGATRSPVVAGALLALCGAGSAVLLVAARTVLQRVSDFATLCRAFSLAEAADMAMLLAGSLIVPLLVAVVGVRQAPAGVGALVAAAAMLTARPIARAELGASAQLDRLAVLRRSALLAPLPAPSLETLARQSWTRQVAPGDHVVVEGAAGDCYFVIESGEVEVHRSGTTLRHLGPGTGFGEIALLLDTPRTATVTAVTPTSLVVVDRTTFLVAVTGHAPSSERAHTFAHLLAEDTWDEPDQDVG